MKCNENDQVKIQAELHQRHNVLNISFTDKEVFIQSDNLQELNQLINGINNMTTECDSDESQRFSQSIKENAKLDTEKLVDAIKDSEESMKSSIYICNYLFGDYKRMALEKQMKSEGQDTRMLIIERQLRESILKIE